MARKKRRKAGRPKGSKNKLKFHTGTYYAGVVGPKRKRGRKPGTKNKTTGLHKVSTIYVKL